MRAHFNEIYIWACAMVICYFWISIAKGKEKLAISFQK
jgi:hypothetical protein